MIGVLLLELEGEHEASEAASENNGVKLLFHRALLGVIVSIVAEQI
jgi:hypothetical protein